MRILIIGGDGYLGWPTAMHFAQRGHEVAVLDNMIKRRWEAELGVAPLWPIASLTERAQALRETTDREVEVFVGDVADKSVIRSVLERFRPEAIVHYGEQPSAPFSMIDVEHAILSQSNNVLGTLQLAFAMHDIVPDAHLIKLGTMGEYGTPNIDIEEGYIEIEHNGRRDRLPFPKSPGSFYHLSKVHDSHNLMFAARIWNLRVTDLNQGVVYGTDTDETAIDPRLATSFHYDEYFGTVINRFVAQAVVGMPLTVYGKGGQKRGYLNIRDTLQCVEIAALNPAQPGEFRVFNQFTEQFTIDELAERVIAAAAKRGITAERKSIPNPRLEMESHHYNARNSALLALGLQPHRLTVDVLAGMVSWAAQHSERINRDVILPTVQWRRQPEGVRGV